MDILVTQWCNCHTFSRLSIDHEAIVYKVLGCSACNAPGDGASDTISSAYTK